MSTLCWGGTSLTKGVDASGFAFALYKKVYNVTLPRTASAQATSAKLDDVTNGKTIKESKLKAGDLIFYSKNNSKAGVYHVAIYSGNGKVIHEPKAGQKCSYSKLAVAGGSNCKKMFVRRYVPVIEDKDEHNVWRTDYSVISLLSADELKYNTFSVSASNKNVSVNQKLVAQANKSGAAEYGHFYVNGEKIGKTKLTIKYYDKSKELLKTEIKYVVVRERKLPFTEKNVKVGESFELGTVTWSPATITSSDKNTLKITNAKLSNGKKDDSYFVIKALKKTSKPVTLKLQYKNPFTGKKSQVYTCRVTVK